MSDTKEQKNKGTLRLGGKLSLGKSVDTSRLKSGPQGGGKTVTVEVKKSKTFNKVTKKPVQKEGADAPAQGGGTERTLSEGEKQARLNALKTAEVLAKEEEKQKQEIEERRRKREEEKAKEAAAPPITAEEEELRKSRARKPGLERRAKDDDLDEEGGAKKGKSSLKERKKSSREKLEELYEEEEIETALKEAAASEDEDEEAVRARLAAIRAFADDEEYEDYSEDVDKVEEDTSVLMPSKLGSDEAQKTGLVNPVKGGERVVLSAPDPERLKKNLRSERRVGQPRQTESQRSGVSQLKVTPKEPSSDERGRGSRRKSKRTVTSAPQEKIYREVALPETITVQELANRMTEQVAAVVKELMKLGTMARPTDVIDADTAELVIQELGHTVKRVSDAEVEEQIEDREDAPEALQARPPVVTVMGHVDHGKTSLLDALRETDVTAGEAGGITQHIGAYQVQLSGGDKITFLDTPGHAAFTSMRARGANLTDIVVLVVAADDGIMDQTREAIDHAKAAGVPIIVAVNKIDKPDADPQKVKGELFNYELVPEEFGGDVMTVDVSALQKMNLDKLEEAILLQAEMLELQANPDREARGAVVEAKVDKGRGVVATLLIQKGTLKVGDIVVAGKSFGKIRAINNDKAQALKEAGPSLPVEVLGLSEPPEAGDQFVVVDSEKTAREITGFRIQKAKEKETSIAAKVSVEDFFSSGGAEGQTKELAMIIKGDVHGSVEAIKSSIDQLGTDEAKANIILSGVGEITESDVALAMTSNAEVVGFNVRANAQAKALAAKEGVDIRYYAVIYDLIDDVKGLLSGMLAPKIRENFLGYAEIREVFNITKAGKVAGCMVTDGTVRRGAKVRLLRDNVVIHDGTLKTLKRFKEDVREVQQGYECGMAFENYDDIREGDMIECYELEELKRSIDDKKE